MIPLPHLKIPWSPSWSSVRYHLSLCSALVTPSSFSSCSQKVDPKKISPILASSTRGNINFSERNIHGDPNHSIPRPTRQPYPQLPQLPQPPDEIILLLLTPLHLILHPHQTPLSPDNFPLPLLLLLILNYLSWIEISPSPRPIFWPSDKKSPQGNPLR